MKVSATFTIQLMSNHTTNMNLVPTESNCNLKFSEIWHGKKILRVCIMLQILKTYYLR